MSDSKYFQKGKVEELKGALIKDTKRKQTIKRIIANMTFGNDMSALFPDLLPMLPSSSIDVKKLIYIYIVFYSKLNRNLANEILKACLPVCLESRDLSPHYLARI